MRTAMVTIGGAGMLALAACSDDSATTAPPKAEKAATLAAGEYEVATKVEDLRSTDHTTPLTKAKLTGPDGAPTVQRACVAADGTIAPEVFTEPGDTCKINNSYARSGKINMQIGCERAGAPGNVMHSIDGNFESESFTATVNTGTYFTGSGDYAMRRSMTGKRVGVCPASAEKKS